MHEMSKPIVFLCRKNKKTIDLLSAAINIKAVDT